MRFVIILAAIGFVLVVPASADAVTCPFGQPLEANGTEAADWPVAPPSGRCVSFAEWEKEFEAAEAAHKAQEAATATHEAEERAAKEHQEQLEANKETGGPPTYLNVTPISLHGDTYRKPGHTRITSPQIGMRRSPLNNLSRPQLVAALHTFQGATGGRRRTMGNQ